MFLDLLNKTSSSNANAGEQPSTMSEGDLLQIAKQFQTTARAQKRYRRRPETILHIDEEAQHWNLPWVKFLLGLLDPPRLDRNTERGEHDPISVQIQYTDLRSIRENQSIDSIAIPTTHDLSGGKKAIREKFFPSAVRENAICLSYVQTADGDIPETAVSDWAWLRSHIGEERSPSIWCDKLPLAGGADWWAKKAPLLYAMQPVLISPPSGRSSEYGSKMEARNEGEELWFAILFSTGRHISSCTKCRKQFESVLSSLAEVIVRTAHEHPAPGRVADMLKQCSVSHCVDEIMSGEMAEPGWRLRLWPRMEATVALQARGGVFSPRGFYSVAKLALFQSFVSAWALTEYGSVDMTPIEQSLGVRGMTSFWEPTLYTFRKCWAKDGRFDKGIYGATMQHFTANNESYERSLLSRSLPSDGNILCVQYMLQFLSCQESLNSENIWTGCDGLFREKQDSLGPQALKVTVMELFRIPTETGDVFDPGDIIRWIKEVQDLGQTERDLAPEMIMLDEARRYALGIRRQDHCALGKYSGPHVELGWMRYCNRERLHAAEEAWRLNLEAISVAEFVREYYVAEFDLGHTLQMTLRSQGVRDDAVCVNHCITEYKKVGFALGWRCKDPMTGVSGFRIWFCRVNDEVEVAHLDCVMWIDGDYSIGGADDAFWISSGGGSKKTEWYEERGKVCAECGAELGTWGVFQAGGTAYGAYACGNGAVPVWLPYNLV